MIHKSCEKKNPLWADLCGIREISPSRLNMEYLKYFTPRARFPKFHMDSLGGMIKNHVQFVGCT